MIDIDNLRLSSRLLVEAVSDDVKTVGFSCLKQNNIVIFMNIKTKLSTIIYVSMYVLCTYCICMYLYNYYMGDVLF